MTIELNEQKKTKNTDAKFISKYISGLITRFDDVQRYFPNNSMAIVYHSYELRRATTFSRNTCFCSAVLFATSVKSVRFIGCAFSSNKKKYLHSVNSRTKIQNGKKNPQITRTIVENGLPYRKL